MQAIKTTLFSLAALVGSSSLATASDLNVQISSGGSSLVVVGPGDSVNWQILGELSDAANEGLAMFAVDLEFTGGALAQANAPGSGPMVNFDRPAGFTNPAGYGGTPTNGALLQVGGAQNTIKNSFAQIPVGNVQTDVAAPGSPVVLVDGSLTAPAVSGTYQLSITDSLVNVIRQGEDGSGEFWAVDGAALNVVHDLTVVVLDCSAENYCQAAENSQGCLAMTSSSGTPTLGGADDFVISASDLINRSFAALVVSTSFDTSPFGGGTLCVSQPFSRFGVQSTGGNPQGIDCSGSLTQPISHADMLSRGWSVGTTVFTQVLYRDFLDVDRLGLSDGTVFIICP